MVTLLCGAADGASGKPMKSYREIGEEIKLRRYGNPYFVLIGCNVNVPDMTDLAAVAALVASGDMHIGPKGKIDIAKPSVVTSDEIDICTGPVPLSSTYALAYTTYSTDEEDCEYWGDILKRHASMRMMWFDCDQNFYAQSEYIDFLRDPANASAPTGSPGFEFTVVEPPHPVEGDGKKVRWEIGFSIEMPGNEIFRYRNLPGLFAAMQDA